MTGQWKLPIRLSRLSFERLHCILFLVIICFINCTGISYFWYSSRLQVGNISSYLSIKNIIVCVSFFCVRLSQSSDWWFSTSCLLVLSILSLSWQMSCHGQRCPGMGNKEKVHTEMFGVIFRRCGWIIVKHRRYFQSMVDEKTTWVSGKLELLLMIILMKHR